MEPGQHTEVTVIDRESEIRANNDRKEDPDWKSYEIENDGDNFSEIGQKWEWWYEHRVLQVGRLEVKKFR